MSPIRTSSPNLFSYCCQSTNEKFRSESLKCLSRFVTICSDTFANEQPLMDTLLETLTTLVSSMSTLTLFVETLSSFVTLFEPNPMITDKLVAVMEQVAVECNSKRKDEMVPCWCAARKEYFRCALLKGMDDEAWSHFMGSLNLYFELIENDVDLHYWDELIVSILSQALALDDARFTKCIDKSMELICDLVEVRSEPVREELMKVLQRKLTL